MPFAPLKVSTARQKNEKDDLYISTIISNESLPRFGVGSFGPSFNDTLKCSFFWSFFSDGPPWRLCLGTFLQLVIRAAGFWESGENSSKRMVWKFLTFLSRQQDSHLACISGKGTRAFSTRRGKGRLARGIPNYRAINARPESQSPTHLAAGINGTAENYFYPAPERPSELRTI